MNDWIVVVDDDALSLTNARMLLNAQNMRVGCLRSGRELLKFMEKNTPDLILLDILMPEMDGFETYRRLRIFEDEAGRNHTPVIFLTGENDSEMERRGLKAGASDFIRKPFNQEILLRRIRNTINNSKTIESLTEKATVDKLTGFLNKASGTERVSALCKEEIGALLILDLDNFKLVNDLFGHEMGDRVLIAFAEIVRHNTREDDIVCRIGGDEFLGFFRNVTEEKAVAALTKRMNDQIVDSCTKLMGEDFGIPIGISIGAAMVPEHGTEYHKLFQYVDSSLYRVKQNGKHGYDIYSPSLVADKLDNDLTREITRVTQIVEERGDGNGALLLGQDMFSVNYRYIIRYLRRSNGHACKLLFEFTTEKSESDLTELAMQFGLVLQKSLRKCDIIMQSKPNQFFLLLPGLSAEDVPGVVARIMKAWEMTSYHDEVEIEYASELVSYEK